MKKLAIIALLLLLVGCSGEPESKYRLEYNEILKVYRIGEWDTSFRKWREDGMYFWSENAKVYNVNQRDKVSVMTLLNELRSKEAATKEALAKYAKEDKAWKEVITP